MSKKGYIYFMTNQHNTVLYIGVTKDLTQRVAEHKAKINHKGFTYKYNCEKLVYFETSTIEQAIRREKQLKNWKREWKNSLVNKVNAEWNDLSKDIGVDNEFIKSVKDYYKIVNQVRHDID